MPIVNPITYFKEEPKSWVDEQVKVCSLTAVFQATTFFLTYAVTKKAGRAFDLSANVGLMTVNGAYLFYRLRRGVSPLKMDAFKVALLILAGLIGCLIDSYSCAAKLKIAAAQLKFGDYLRGFKAGWRPLTTLPMAALGYQAAVAGELWSPHGLRDAAKQGNVAYLEFSIKHKKLNTRDKRWALRAAISNGQAKAVAFLKQNVSLDDIDISMTANNVGEKGRVEGLGLLLEYVENDPAAKAKCLLKLYDLQRNMDSPHLSNT